MKTLRSFAFILAILSPHFTLAQEFPAFLEGTWKRVDADVYEHWDKLNENLLKGVAYEMKDGRPHVLEYLDISRSGNKIVYTATLPGENAGKPISFRQTASGETFTFENTRHDFPKKITYHRLSDTEVAVDVSGEDQNGFAFTMRKSSGKTTKNETANPNFDKALAEKLGGDDYGMKSYLFVILKTGNNTTTDKELISESFRGHLDNINRLVEENKLIVAGPLGKNENGYRGIFIFQNVPTQEEARALLETDPAIKAGLLDFELYTWYGSAALPVYLDASDRIWKAKP